MHAGMLKKRRGVYAHGIPIRGTASLVFGMISETMFMNTVRDRRIVTSETRTVGAGVLINQVNDLN